MKLPVKLNYDDCILILDALDDARAEFEQLEEQSDWYSGGKLIDKLEEAREILNLKIAEAGYDS